ncbi:MAG: cytochrome P450 [Cyanobacteria bacterium SID2]|nr:cytochrome P450 [Cyanobacteria bacterium SID2]MBP0003413.1 cytochrome P450 [Cyanobacteria bacterium SBC]
MTLPNGPKTSPTWQMLEWTIDPIGYMERNTKKFGETFTARLGHGLNGLVFVSNPDNIREILTAEAQQFDAGRTNGILQIFVGDRSILLLDGAAHKQRRKLLMPPFHGDRVLTYGNTIIQATLCIVDERPLGRAFPVRSIAQEITMRVIFKAIFGLNEGERYDLLYTMMADILEMTASPLKASLLFFRILQQDWGPWSPWGRFLRRQKELDDLLYTVIRERRETLDASRTDILTLLLSATDENGESMSDRELRDELVTLLLAGHETTATALSWALYWTHKYPEVCQRLLAELDELGETPDLMAVFKLPYLTAVCNETLRLHPVALITFPRIVNGSFQMGDRTFEEDTVLAPCIYMTHHREDLYPDSDRFNPDRFLDRQYSPFEFYPFGGGNRRCLGMALALYELKLALATMLRHYEFALPEDRPIKPMRRGITLAPSGNLQLVKLRRRSPSEVRQAASAVGS